MGCSALHSSCLLKVNMGGLLMYRIRHTQQSGGGKGATPNITRCAGAYPKSLVQLYSSTVATQQNTPLLLAPTTWCLSSSNNTPQQNWVLNNGHSVPPTPPHIHPTSLNGHLSPLPPEERLPTLCQEAKVGTIFSSDNQNIYMSVLNL